MNPFAEELIQLNEKHRETVNGPTRSKFMMFTALSIMDAYKMQALNKPVATTEAEFLDMCKRWFWEAQEALQKQPTPVLEAPAEKRDCSNCKNRCMDLEPYCAVLNPPFGQTLKHGKPVACGDAGRLWELDTRGK